MVQTANLIWGDYVTDGVPSSGNKKPKKSEIRTWGTWIEGIITAFTATGGRIYSSKAAMDADLAHAANTMAWVIGDATVANNGVYQKQGASGAGSWTRVADLPFSFIIASDAGAGTANAIQATTSIPVSGSALIWMNIFEANTASPVTVSFNGGSALTIKTNSGNDVAAGGLTAGMIVLGIVSGSTFRLVSDQASAAVLAACEAAQAAAEAAAATATGVKPVATRAAMKATNTSIVKAFDLMEGAPARNGRMGRFYAVDGDFSAHVAADPNEGVFIAIDGISPSARALVRAGWGDLDPHWFGCVGDGVTDDNSAFQACVDFIADIAPERKAIALGNARYLISSIVIPEECEALEVYGNGPYASQIYSSDVTAGNVITCYAQSCQFLDFRLQNATFDVSTVARNGIELTKDYGPALPACDIDAEFHNVEISRFQKAIKFKGRGLRVENSLLSVCYNGIALDYPSPSEYTPGTGVQEDLAGFRAIFITDNRFHSFTSSAITNIGTNASKINNLQIEDNQLDIGRPLFEGHLGVGGSVIAGNTIGLTPLEGLLLTGGNDYLVSDNVISGSEGIAGGERIPDNFVKLTGNHDSGVFKDNVYKRCKQHGIDCRSGVVTNMVFEGETFIDPCRDVSTFSPYAFVGANHKALIKNPVVMTSNSLLGLVRGNDASQSIAIIGAFYHGTVLPNFVGIGAAVSQLGTLTAPIDKIYASKIALVDGSSTPADEVGAANMWVSGSDGDLKIKFGDNVIKTIVVDT